MFLTVQVARAVVPPVGGSVKLTVGGPFVLLPLSRITTDVTLPSVIILVKSSFWLLPDTATPSSFTYPVPSLIILILLLLDIIPDAVILGLDTLSLVPGTYPTPGEIISNLLTNE